MKRFSILTIAFVAILCASPALAGNNGNKCNGPGDDNCPSTSTFVDGDQFNDFDNSTTNKAYGGDGGTGFGVGVGVGIGEGGDASSSLGLFNDFGGDAKAYGGDGGDGGEGGAGGDASLGFFNDFGGDADSSSSSYSKTNTSTSQGQSQGQVGIVKDGDVAVDSHDSVVVDASDNSTHSIDNDFPVNTAAPVFAGNCSQGVSAQTQGFGGSIASGNSVCDYIAVAGAFIAGGDRAEAFRVLGKAETAADWRFMFSRIRMVITLGLL